MNLGDMSGASHIDFDGGCMIVSCASVVGPKEGRGPLGEYFDEVTEDDLLQQSSWEKAERKMLAESARLACAKIGLTTENVQFLLAGDLLNQIITSGYAAREIDVPFLGLYGACSTFVESLLLGACLVEGGFAESVICATASHHKTAERQYRLPTEFASQRPKESQWTVTGAGAFVLAGCPRSEDIQDNQISPGAVVVSATPGRVVDFEVKDPFNMGAAMAPAAADTLLRHFSQTGTGPEDYDLILSGDLGRLGYALTVRLMQKSKGIDISGDNFKDAGILIYSKEQKVNAGGSGCACQPVTFAGYIWDMVDKWDLQRILLVGTGALHSPVACQQGETIPGIAHVVELEFTQTNSCERE